MFALCVDASHARGMGHLFRALALAEALESQGTAVHIYVNNDQRAASVLRDRGYPWRAVPLAGSRGAWEPALVRADGIKVWVDDRLNTDVQHARRVLEAGARLATFDDRGSGAAMADVNIVAVPLTDNEQIPGKRVLSGLSYLVIDPAVVRYRRLRRERTSTVVSMGGSDTYGVTVDVVRALRRVGRHATIVLGPGFAHDSELDPLLNESFVVKRSVASLAEEFSRHDLAITAGGLTPFEANAAGLPCVVIATEPWEVRTGEVLARLGGSIYAGWREQIDFVALEPQFPIEKMSRAALATVPTDGASRVAKELLAL